MVFNSIQALVHSWSFIIDHNIFPPNKSNFSMIFEQRKTSAGLPDKALRVLCLWNKEEQVTELHLLPPAKTQLSK